MSSALYERYALLPRPPRSPFSRGNDDTRAMFPDFTADPNPVEAVAAFLQHIYFPYIPSSYRFERQLEIGLALMSTFFVAFVAIIARLIVRRSLWFFRFTSGRDGARKFRINALTCFAAFEIVFGILFIASMAMFLRFWTDGYVPNHVPAWVTLPFVPLITAGILAGLGTLQMRPSVVQPTPHHPLDRKTRRKRMRRRLYESLVNWGFTLPFAVVFTTVPPIAIADIKWQKSLRAYDEWTASYSAAETLSNELLTDAQKIWFGTISSMEKVSVVYAIMTGWALLLGVVYGITGMSFLRHLSKHMNKTKVEVETQQWEQDMGLRVEDAANANSANDASPVATASRDSQDPFNSHPFTAEELAGDLPSSAFFPPVKPSEYYRHQQQTASSQGRLSTSLVSGSVAVRQRTVKSHSRHLTHVFRTFAIQYVAICGAEVVFGAEALAAMFLFLKGYEHNEAGIYVPPVFFAALWTCLIAGSVTILGLFFHTWLDPDVSMPRSTRRRVRRPHQQEGPTHHEEEMGVLHDTLSPRTDPEKSLGPMFPAESNTGDVFIKVSDVKGSSLSSEDAPSVDQQDKDLTLKTMRSKTSIRKFALRLGNTTAVASRRPTSMPPPSRERDEGAEVGETRILSGISRAWGIPEGKDGEDPPPPAPLYSREWITRQPVWGPSNVAEMPEALRPHRRSSNDISEPQQEDFSRKRLSGPIESTPALADGRPTSLSMIDTRRGRIQAAQSPSRSPMSPSSFVVGKRSSFRSVDMIMPPSDPPDAPLPPSPNTQRKGDEVFDTAADGSAGQSAFTHLARYPSGRRASLRSTEGSDIEMRGDDNSVSPSASQFLRASRTHRDRGSPLSSANLGSIRVHRSASTGPRHPSSSTLEELASRSEGPSSPAAQERRFSDYTRPANADAETILAPLKVSRFGRPRPRPADESRRQQVDQTSLIGADQTTSITALPDSDIE